MKRNYTLTPEQARASLERTQAAMTDYVARRIAERLVATDGVGAEIVTADRLMEARARRLRCADVPRVPAADNHDRNV